MSKDDYFSGSNPFLRDITERLKEINVDRLVPMPASRFSMEALTDIYNEARADYIIPMPMSPPQLEEYIDVYDLNLSDSVVIMDTIVGQLVGLGFLGLRENRAWISRFGVVTMLRESDIGAIILEYLIAAARYKGATTVEIEMIEGDVYCNTLVKKIGFEYLDSVLVGRRPPEMHPETPNDPPEGVALLFGDEAIEQVTQSQLKTGWRNALETYKKFSERVGVVKVDDLTALGSGSAGSGLVIFENKKFQLDRIMVEVTDGDPTAVTVELLSLLHALYPRRDAQVVNFPIDDPKWAGFKEIGYFESYRRNRFLMKIE